MFGPPRMKPPMVIRRLRRWHLLVCVFPLSWFAVDLAPVPAPHWMMRLPWVLAWIAGMHVVLGVARLAERLIRRRAAAMDGCLCTHCLYTLIEVAGICPECGDTYTHEELRREWAVR